VTAYIRGGEKDPFLARIVRSPTGAILAKSTVMKWAFADLIKDKTGADGRAFFEFFFALMNGKAFSTEVIEADGTKRVHVEVPTIRERMAAAQILMEHSHGKPKQALEVSGPGGGPVTVIDVAALSLDQIDALGELADKAK
jgi:hypothetical protein